MSLLSGSRFIRVVGLVATTALSGACGEETHLVPIGAAPAAGLAVVNSDFMSTSISLLNPVTQTLATDDCINSGSSSPTLALTLSGDVTLPSQPQPGNELALVDRGNAVITWLDPTNCAVKRQLKVSTDFNANPKDLAAVSATKAYVPRYEVNATPGVVEHDGGDDLLIIDPTAAEIVGRIDLAPYAAPVDGKVIQARPDRAVYASGQVFVTLGSQDAMFSAAGEGRVVVIDPAIDAVTATLPLTGLKGCSGMDFLAGSKTLMVVCGGSFSDADQAAASGLALIDVAATPPTVKTVITAAAITGERPLNFSTVVAVSDDVVLLSAIGRRADAANAIEAAPDALLQLNLSSGAVSALLETTAFELGRAAGSPTLAMVPQGSATRPRVQVFTISDDGAVTRAADLDANPARGLPPREIAWY